MTGGNCSGLCSTGRVSCWPTPCPRLEILAKTGVIRSSHWRRWLDRRQDDVHCTPGDRIFHDIRRREVIDWADALTPHEIELAGDIVGLRHIDRDVGRTQVEIGQILISQNPISQTSSAKTLTSTALVKRRFSPMKASKKSRMDE